MFWIETVITNEIILEGKLMYCNARILWTFAYWI